VTLAATSIDALAVPANPAALSPADLHSRYARQIARQVRSVMGRDDDHEDLVQEVLMAVMRGVGTLRDPACMDGWVARVTANTVHAAIRRRRVRRHASLDALSEREWPIFQDKPDTRDLAWRAIDLMNRMPPRDRALLASYWFSPATVEAIAADANCSTITVRRRLWRALRRFERLAQRDPALAPCMKNACIRRKRASSSDTTTTRNPKRADANRYFVDHESQSALALTP